MKNCDQFRDDFMDRGYDSEEPHRQIRGEMDADSVILVRTLRRKINSGKCRLEMNINFDSECYHERNKVETVFSHQRRFGEDLKARKIGTRLRR